MGKDIKEDFDIKNTTTTETETFNFRGQKYQIYGINNTSGSEGNTVEISPIAIVTDMNRQQITEHLAIMRAALNKDNFIATRGNFETDNPRAYNLHAYQPDEYGLSQTPYWEAHPKALKIITAIGSSNDDYLQLAAETRLEDSVTLSKRGEAEQSRDNAVIKYHEERLAKERNADQITPRRI